jgi:hypothetical protein
LVQNQQQRQTTSFDINNHANNSARHFSFTFFLVYMVGLSCGTCAILHLEGVEGLAAAPCFLPYTCFFLFLDGVEGFASVAILFLPFFDVAVSPLFVSLFGDVADVFHCFFFLVAAALPFLSFGIDSFIFVLLVVILALTLRAGTTTSLVDGATSVNIAKFLGASISLDPQPLQIYAKN